MIEVEVAGIDNEDPFSSADLFSGEAGVIPLLLREPRILGTGDEGGKVRREVRREGDLLDQPVASVLVEMEDRPVG